MRNSSIMFLILMALSLAVGCAGPLSQVRQAERQYEAAQAEKEREAAQAARAQAEAEAALRKETEAGQGLATALVTDAEEKAAMVVGILDRAFAQRKRACGLNPQLDICKTAEPPPAAAAPLVQAPAPVPPPQPSYVDVNMKGFSAEGMQRLTPLPVGWVVGFDSTKGHLYLEVNGTRKYGYRKPDQFRSGICYRFLEGTLEVCPPPPPAP